MKYLLLIYMSETALTQPEREQCYADSTKLAWDLKKQKPTTSRPTPSSLSPGATTLRIREGKRLVTDGPFAETREQIAGYYLVDAANLDEATTSPAKPGRSLRHCRNSSHSGDSEIYQRRGGFQPPSVHRNPKPTQFFRRRSSCTLQRFIEPALAVIIGIAISRMLHSNRRFNP